MHTAEFWTDHFQNNLTVKRINWDIKPNLTNREKAEILYSLKAWQLGETSDGKHLLAAAAKHANQYHEPAYVEAVKLFIKEEQKHGRNLAKYLTAIGEETIQKDWGDYFFRKIRHLNTSMELWTITVLIVESAAQIFYQALSDASNCPLLKSICNDILIDEAHHIKFQNERLWKIFEHKGFYQKALSIGLYGILFFGTIHAVWFGHKRAFRAGGVNKKEFMRQMYYKFFNSLKYSHSKPAPMESNYASA